MMIIFVGLFLLTVIGVIISTTHSYEAKLIKAIDMLNGYFINNPKIRARRPIYKYNAREFGFNGEPP